MNKRLEMRGKVVEVLPTVFIPGKDGEYPSVSFEMVPDDFENGTSPVKNVVFKTYKSTSAVVKNLKRGDYVKVNFIPESRRVDDKVFNDHKAYWVERIN